MSDTGKAAKRLSEAHLEAALAALGRAVPYHSFLGVHFSRLGDELTAILDYNDRLIGNPLIPALHGGVTGAFLEIAAITQLAWDRGLERMAREGPSPDDTSEADFGPWPKTVDISIDYLRSGRPQPVYARAEIVKRGRRVANIRAEAWQSERDRPIAALHGHFLVPEETPSEAG